MFIKSSVDLCAKEGTFVHSVLCPKSQSLLILCYLLSFGKYQGLEILRYPNHIGNEDLISMGCAPGKMQL